MLVEARGVLIATVLGLAVAGCGGGEVVATATTAPSPQPPAPPQATQAPAATTAPPTPPAPAEPPVIVVQRGIGTATLDMTVEEVTASLGAPVSIAEFTNVTGPYTELAYPFEITIAFQRGEGFSGAASSFFVAGAGPATPEAVGVGSTEEDVAARISGKCEDIEARRVCFVGDFAEPGAIITEFEVDAGVVSSVRVARLR